MTSPSFADWQYAAPRLKLQLRAGELVGPCPACGGVDRFHVRRADRGRALVGCRGCIDGRAPSARSAFGGVLRAAFGDAAPAPAAAVVAPVDPPPRTADQAAAIWRGSVPGTGTPTHAYLAGRHVWPPPGVGPDLPPDVRWHPDMGVAVFGWRRPDGTVTAVSLEALDRQGRRPAAGLRYRRTFGTRRGAVFRASTGGPSIVVVEGEASALAAVWLWPGVEVVAAGGTAGMAAWRRPPGDSRPVIIEADGDLAGDRAARALAAATGATLCLRPGGDPADDLADAVIERIAIAEHEGGSSAADAVTAAWSGPFGPAVSRGQPEAAPNRAGRP